MQFSVDPSIDPKWFGRIENSVYGQINSRDIQNLPDDDQSWDIVICNHVLEHVADPNSAVQELNRITRDDGFLVLSYPLPITRAITDDWGYPKPELHDHYRTFGRDYEDTLHKLLPNRHVVATQATDPITKTDDLFYIICSDGQWYEKLISSKVNTRVLPQSID